MCFLRPLSLWSVLVAGLLISAAAGAGEGVAVGFPAAGTELTFERSVNGRTTTTTWTVAGGSTFDGQPVYRLESGEDFDLYDRDSKSWVASRRHGRVKRVTPHNGQLNGPLYVGKEWDASYLYKRRDGSQAEQQRTWKVAARETVEVPAGRFDAFRIVSEGRAVTLTLWYAPAIDFFVKRTTEGMVEVRRVLVEYRAASGGNG
ncbi:MAG TPA: hypothetical protein VKA64_10840 [Gammaproteobacteria bacterium]|nr:hypothetical protein [Gammaproteobacteria bacterium]